MARRKQAIEKFSWPVPTDAAIRTIGLDQGISLEERHAGRLPSRVLEIGSGSGYWASLVDHLGCDITAVDDGSERLDNDNPFPWFPKTVQQSWAEYITERNGCKDCTLFFCWPRDISAALDAYAGDTVVVVGEGDDGATDARLEVDNNWKEVMLHVFARHLSLGMNCFTTMPLG
jgi:hypothetical protein